MEDYVGLDVSLEQTSIRVVNHGQKGADEQRDRHEQLPIPAFPCPEASFLLGLFIAPRVRDALFRSPGSETQFAQPRQAVAADRATQLCPRTATKNHRSPIIPSA